ncbi:hypothetical protein WJ97_12220 [Burkholderia ubonensis]|nr:hypothetical protein WJ97_12220 [Burkholderia ubonensis]
MAWMDEKMAATSLKEALKSLGQVRGTYQVLLVPPGQVQVSAFDADVLTPEGALVFGFLEFSAGYSPADLLKDSAQISLMASSIADVIKSKWTH